MEDYIVTVVHPKQSIFDKGITKFRQPANGEIEAKKLVKRHSLFPVGGEIIRVRQAAYKKK